MRPNSLHVISRKIIFLVLILVRQTILYFGHNTSYPYSSNKNGYDIISSTAYLHGYLRLFVIPGGLRKHIENVNVNEAWV